MTLSDSRRKANDKYIAEHYSRIALSMPNSEADALRAYCSKHGLTVAGFIRNLIKQAIHDKPEREFLVSDDLNNAIMLVAETTGETREQLITRHLMQNLHHDVDCLGSGMFKMVGGYDRGRIDILNNAVSKATGYNADEWMIKDGKEWADDEREYVRAHQGSKDRILWPGEVPPVGDNGGGTGAQGNHSK